MAHMATVTRHASGGLTVVDDTRRAASSDMMDEHMPSIGIPNFVDFMRRKAKSFYFCFVTTMEKGPLPAASPAGTAL